MKTGKLEIYIKRPSDSLAHPKCDVYFRPKGHVKEPLTLYSNVPWMDMPEVLATATRYGNDVEFTILHEVD